MATYCFETDQKAVLTEAAVRGWHAAILDFPRLLDSASCAERARSVPVELWPEVCCVTDELFYALLVASVFDAFYIDMPQLLGERRMARLVVEVRPMQTEEARAFLQRRLMEEIGTREVDDLYACYQGAMSQLRQ